jgi:hypothetical protein
MKILMDAWVFVQKVKEQNNYILAYLMKAFIKNYKVLLEPPFIS